MNVLEFKDELFQKGSEKGFKDMELYYEKSDRFVCAIDKGEVDQFTTAEVTGVSFRGVYADQMGYAYTEKLDESSIEFLIENALENASVLESEDVEEIYEGDSNYKDISFSSEALKSVTNEEKINFMKELDKEIYAADERVVATNFFTMQSVDVQKAMYNSKGLALEDDQNYLVYMVIVIVEENDVTKSGVHIEVVSDWGKVNAKESAQKAVQEAVSYLNPLETDDKFYPVILRQDAARSLLDTFVTTFSAETAQQGMSKLKEKVGSKIAGDNINLVDDPFMKNRMGSRTFDAEGVATEKLNVVENGTLTTLLHNRKTAKKDGVKTTGHASKVSYKGTVNVAPSNFYIEPGSQSYDELVQGLDEGIVVTNLQGLHSGVNAISGDFSLAANGYYVKDGKIQGPTNLMTIAGNFFELLNEVNEVGSDLEFGPSNVGAPSLLLKGLSVTFE
ncbi:PmbA protein [Alkalibacillus filiformis]|uniref:PmbA protein n=1 Tax=Alkalibacillus filiformis TaxID=200990 RepID=A0ABU0DU43_9BACI|nr:metallopeptidase TldD-related protein [Alkalibacillus filiformis]MDQ0351875.1 PmbA protein [Alkalibacillus filiformis]